MVHGIRYVRQDISYLSKKHSCPVCGTQMNVVKRSKVINSGSDEAQNIPPIVPKTVIGTKGVKFRTYNAVGNIKWIWKEFECPSCNRCFTVDEMKEIESAPTEYREDLIASFDEAKLANDESNSEIDSSLEEHTKKNLKLPLIIAISVVLLLSLIAVGVVMIIRSMDVVDTNGPDNFALTEITMEDILSNKTGYSSMNASSSYSGYHTEFIGDHYIHSDYDKITKSFGKVKGTMILQATKIYKDTLTLEIESIIESGNAEIVVIVDGEYYQSAELNKKHTMTLKNIYGKEVIVKLAAEGAKIKVSVKRSY